MRAHGRRHRFKLGKQLVRFGRRLVVKHDFLRLKKMRGDARSVSRFYDFWAPVYDWIYGGNNGIERAVEILVEECVHRDDRVLDLGTGTGMAALGLARKARFVVGLDLHGKMLARTARKVEALRRDEAFCPIDLIQGNALFLPFRRGSFDLVTSSFCLVYLTMHQRVEALKECRRVLASEGRLALLTSMGELNDRFCTLGEWEAILEAAGYREIRVEDRWDVFRFVEARV